MSTTFTLAEVRSMAHKIVYNPSLTTRLLNCVRDVYAEHDKNVLVTDTEFDKKHTIELPEDAIEAVYQNYRTHYGSASELDPYM